MSSYPSYKTKFLSNIRNVSLLIGVSVHKPFTSVRPASISVKFCPEYPLLTKERLKSRFIITFLIFYITLINVPYASSFLLPKSSRNNTKRLSSSKADKSSPTKFSDIEPYSVIYTPSTPFSSTTATLSKRPLTFLLYTFSFSSRRIL